MLSTTNAVSKKDQVIPITKDGYSKNPRCADAAGLLIAHDIAMNLVEYWRQCGLASASANTYLALSPDDNRTAYQIEHGCCPAILL